MKPTDKKFNPLSCALIIMLAGMLCLAGCVRYAHNADILYEPSTTVRGGSGDVYIVVPANSLTHASDVKWVVGDVTDNDNYKIDEVFSSRSPAEILQTALGLELSKAGYTVIPATSRPNNGAMVVDLTKTDITLEQISGLTDLKAKCKIVMGVDVFKKNQMIKRLQFESMSSMTDIKDRDLLAKSVLKDALQSVMKSSIPDLSALLVK